VKARQDLGLLEMIVADRTGDFFLQFFDSLLDVFGLVSFGCHRRFDNEGRGLHHVMSE
jgi:hypothetical protein